MRKGDETIFNKFALEEVFHLLCGEQISRGRGRFRTVYACRFDPTLVIKIEPNGGDHSNQQEIRLWTAYKDVPEVSRWLAPCIDISPGGVALLQRRVRPVRRAELPNEIPSFLNTDARHFNWGMLDGKMVCCDYADLEITVETDLVAADYGHWDETSQW